MYPSNYPPNLKRKLQRSRVHSMQDVLLTVPDPYFCYEVAKAARQAWTTLATRNLHVVGRFNSLNSPPPPPPTVFLRIESCRKMFFGSMARSCGRGAASILLLKYRRTLRLHLGVLGTTVGAKLQGKRQVAATATCDVDHFQETSICMTSVRSMYVWSSRIAEYGSTG